MDACYHRRMHVRSGCCFLLRLALCIFCCQSSLSLVSPSAASQRTPRQASASSGQRLTLANGYSIVVPQGAFTYLTFFQGSKKIADIALGKAMEGWLHQQAVWSDAGKANDMLYMQLQGADFQPILQDVTPLSDRLLAILDWQDQAGSGQPVKAQHLVQIQIGPHPAVKLLRDLPLGQEVQYALPPPRLFASGKRLLLFTGAEDEPKATGRLQTLTPEGKVIATLARFPAALYPTALEKPYLLQLKDSGYGVAQPFWTYNLRTKQLHHRPERVPVAQDKEPQAPKTPAERLQEAIGMNDVPAVRKLLAQGVPADVEMLIQTCRNSEDRTEMLRVLLDKGLPVNAKDSTGETPLFAILENARPDTQQSVLKNLALLVEHGADVRTANQGETFLARVVTLHLDAVARFVIQHGADPAQLGQSKLTPLHVAALVNDGARVQALVQAGANVNAPDSMGETPLFMAATADAAQAAQALLSAGADPNAFHSDNEFRFSALYTALQAGSPDVALLLVTHGADVNASGPYGETPLVQALDMWGQSPEENRSEPNARQTFTARKDAVIEALLQKGANINATDKQGLSPLSSAMRLVSFIHGRNWFQELLQRGADPNVRIVGGRTVLFEAINSTRGDLTIPLQLLNHGADVNGMDEAGITPLLEAVSQQDFSLARLLIEHGAQVECHDRVHKTPLLWAAYYGQLDLLKRLIAKGANLRARDDLGQNALALARKGGQAAVVTYLQSQGLR